MVSAWPIPTVPSPAAGLVAEGVVAAGGTVVSSPPPPHPAESAPRTSNTKIGPTLAGKLLTPLTLINVSPAVCLINKGSPYPAHQSSKIAFGLQWVTEWVTRYSLKAQ